MLAVFLDQETTGLDFLKHRTIDIAFKIVDITNGEEVSSYSSRIKIPKTEWDKHDPLSLKVNGFQYDDLLGGKDPDFVAKEIERIFTAAGIKRGKAVFICQNPSFDRGFFTHLIPVDTQEKLNWPYHWLDLASMYWSIRILKSTKGEAPLFLGEIVLSKDEIAKFYGLPPEAKPHKAMNGVEHLLLCYRALFTNGI